MAVVLELMVVKVETSTVLCRFGEIVVVISLWHDGEGYGAVSGWW